MVTNIFIQRPQSPRPPTVSRIVRKNHTNSSHRHIWIRDG